MKEQLKIRLQQKPYFLLLLPVFFIFHGYNAFFGFFPFSFVLINFAVCLCLTGLLYLLSLMLLKQKNKAAAFAFFITLFMLSFGALHDTIKHYTFNFLSRYVVFLPFALFIATILYIVVKKNRTQLLKTFFFVNTLMLLLICYEFFDGAAKWSSYKKGSNLIDNRFRAYNAIKQPVTITDSSKPDIYLLVFDAMPSTIAMKKEWSFDNSNLDSSLSKKGFYINSFSKSNYNLTVLSVASMLNMDYTPPVDIYQDETKMYFKASASILDNSLTRFLSEQKYDIKHYQPVSFNNVDWNSEVFFSDMLYMNYFYQTLPGRMYRDLKWSFLRIKNKLIPSDIFAKVQKQNLQHQADLEKTIQLVKQSCALKKNQPQFVYAHFQLPHDPFIYDSTGNLKPTVKTINIKESDQPAAFIEQVKFADNVILQLIQHIKENNKKNSVIIVAGDHGYRNVFGTRSYMVFDNFSSFYFPDSNYQNIYSPISPVNNFRVVLNNYFNTGLPLLKDSSIFIPYTLPGNK